MRVVLTASNWLRGMAYGIGNEEPAMVWMDQAMDGTFEGRRCCLGHACVAVGIDPERLKGHITPHDITGILETPMSWCAVRKGHGVTPSTIQTDIAKINDNPDTSDEEKIAELTPLFDEKGIELVWEPDK